VAFGWEKPGGSSSTAEEEEEACRLDAEINEKAMARVEAVESKSMAIINQVLVCAGGGAVCVHTCE